MDWYKHYLGDYMRDTSHLTAQQHGYYRLLIDHYYATEKPIPLKFAEIWRILRCQKRSEKADVRHILDEFFTKKDDGYHKTRINQEIENYRKRQEVNRRNASKSHSESQANRVATPETRNQKPDIKKKNIKKKKNTRCVFKKPTVEEIRAYCAERGNDIDPQYFFDSNEAKGWVVGNTKTPMKNWQAVIRTWESNRETNKSTHTKQPNKLERAAAAFREFESR